MANKQTRRTISLSRDGYDRLRAHCEANGIAMSAFVEREINAALDEAALTAPGPSADVHEPLPGVAAEEV